MSECPTCGDSFKNLTATKIHHKKSHNESISGFEYICAYCGSNVIKSTSKYDKAFCDQECMSLWQSENWSGNNNPNYKNSTEKFTCEYCSEEYMLHQSHSNRTKFCSLDCLSKWRSENWTGESSPAWKEINATSEKFTKYERKTILERDNGICQDCGKDNCKLNAHHISPVSKSPTLVHDIDNGVSLCIECHADRHKEPVSSLILSQKN